MSMRYDLHTHTTYSDGSDWRDMVAAAEHAGLAGIGFTDHCAIGPDEFGRRDRYDLVETYPERRTEFANGDVSMTVFDAAEINYEPAKEAAIEAFLEQARFDYVIGSVHFTDGVHFSDPDLSDASHRRRRRAVEDYVEAQIALIESELFDVVGHLDLVQRTPSLRGLMTRSHYERIADAFEHATAIPELNAGRLDRSYGTVHPDPAHVEPFIERDIPFVVGTASHAPDQLRSRVGLLATVLEELPIRVIELPDVLEPVTP